jgi:phenylacetate-CoA ligase
MSPLRHRYEQLHTLWWLWRHPQRSRQALLRFQNRKLRYLLSYAYTNVNYYRRLFDQAGLKPEDIRGLDDLSLIPMTSKQDLKTSSLEDILTGGVDPARLFIYKTSGSTGEPFTIWFGPFELTIRNLLAGRVARSMGVKPLDRKAWVLGEYSDRRGGRDPVRVWKGWRPKLRHRVNYHQSPEEMVREMEQFAPDVIYGYPGVLSQVASAVARSRSPQLEPRLLMTFGETLMPRVRRQIEEGFGAQVSDFYGAYEFHMLAWECPDTGHYHICSDNVILEVLQDGRPVSEGEPGEVVATSLHSSTMPFVRYRLGDVVIKGAEACPCGQPFSTLRSVRGRMVDFFRLPGGSRVDVYDLVEPLAAEAGKQGWLSRFQLVQEREDLIVMRVLPLRLSHQEELDHLKKSVREQLGPTVEFQVDLVDDLAFERSGKFRVAYSKINSSVEESI